MENEKARPFSFKVTMAGSRAGPPTLPKAASYSSEQRPQKGMPARTNKNSHKTLIF
jgi:hypothetical protein